MSMTTNDQATPTNALELSRDAFWEPPVGLCSRVAEALLRQHAEGAPLHLLAPALVDLSERSSLPVLACLRGEAGAPIGPGAFAAHGVIHVMDPQTGHGGATLLSEVASGPLLSTERGVPDRFARVVRVDLRERLKLGWRTGQLLVTALLFGQVSQRALVKLAFPPRLAGADFESYLDSQRPKLLATDASLALLPPEPYRAPLTAPLGGGIALEVDGMQRYVAGFPLRLLGAFDLPCDTEMPPTSLPIRILVLSTAEPRMREGVLWVDLPNVLDGRLRGRFVVDVGAMLPPPSSRLPERLFIYAFSGTAFAGPAMTTRFDDTLVESPLA
jgi:hypothetical protein